MNNFPECIKCEERKRGCQITCQKYLKNKIKIELFKRYRAKEVGKKLFLKDVRRRWYE